MDNIKINYFSAAWCGPCKTFKPVIKKLKKEICIERKRKILHKN